MDQNLERKQELKNKIINFYNLNKVKVFFFILIFLIGVISTIFFKINSERKNILISDKYIQAGLYLSSNNDKKAKILFEEIIQSNNKFYSILAFNTVLEKNLISDKKQILKYFSVLEKSVNTLDNKDLIVFKKALYSKKFFDNKTGEDLFRDLINKDSILKPLAQEVLEK
jgi:hypothetical protein|tara:strand:- start:925 stop:1434 length:510 start_codon:yes stop_codon:yes gene_type:complete